MVPFCQLALCGVAGGWWVFGAVGRADYPEFSAVPDNPDNLVSPVFPVFPVFPDYPVFSGYSGISGGSGLLPQGGGWEGA